MFKLNLVTPEKKLAYNLDVEEVTLPAFKGELNILPGHAPLITTLETGIMKWKIKGEDIQQKAVVSWGYCQVSPLGVNVLADIVDTVEDIDLEEKELLLKNAEEKALSENLTPESWSELQRQMQRARSAIAIKS